jgi:hypothetical protein
VHDNEAMNIEVDCQLSPHDLLMVDDIAMRSKDDPLPYPGLALPQFKDGLAE